MSPDEYTISTDKRRLDLHAIHAFLSQTYWSPGVPLAVVKKVIENSLAFGVFVARSRSASRVWSPTRRHSRIWRMSTSWKRIAEKASKRLLEEIHAHAELQGLRRFLLATRDAHGLYAQFGFQPLANPSRMMERWNPDAYKPAA